MAIIWATFGENGLLLTPTSGHTANWKIDILTKAVRAGFRVLGKTGLESKFVSHLGEVWNFTSKVLTTSVTSFGEILPLWQFFDRLFLIWQNVILTLANLLHYFGKFSLLHMAKY